MDYVRNDMWIKSLSTEMTAERVVGKRKTCCADLI